MNRPLSVVVRGAAAVAACLLGFLAGWVLAVVTGTIAFADEETSETGTQFEGAVILSGDKDVTVDSYGAGSIGSVDDFRYAYFVGNTLYAGVEDSHGNMIDLIGEFYWFESSVDLDSDFYLGVFKVRTTPQLDGGWRLEHDGGPAVYLHSDKAVGEGTGSFRWDWSVPFDNYAWDAYGDVTLETSYGIGADGEGASLNANSTTDENGNTYSASIQSKGFLDLSYRVRSQYQITLYRWELLVQGSATQMDWDLFLNRSDRNRQNSYHEFFLVMQAAAGVPYTVDALEFGGNFRDPKWWWFDDQSRTSTMLSGITLQRPASVDPNSEPTVASDYAVTQSGTPVVINVLANDEDLDGDWLSVDLVTQPAHGKAEVNDDQTVTYTPDVTFAGTDTFTYEATDGVAAGTAPVEVDVMDLGGPAFSDDSTVGNGCGCEIADGRRPRATVLLLAGLAAALALTLRRRRA